MAVTLREEHLRMLCALNHFHIPDQSLIFFGLRGATPVNDENHEFGSSRSLSMSEVDHLHPRCTIGQWRPAERTFAVFPGSTVPHLHYVRSAQARGGQGANQLLTGFYADYRKGIHKAGSSTAHEAFRQTAEQPIQRTSDDLDYDLEDPEDVENPFDNLHAAWCAGVGATEFSSAGCQVVVGYPKCQKLNNQPDSGPWARFKKNAYDLDLDRFDYLLLDARDLAKLTDSDATSLSVRLRFGSQGGLVKKVQRVLREKGFYEGALDGDFGKRSFRAVCAFQRHSFGRNGADGVVGPSTASVLGIEWPTMQLAAGRSRQRIATSATRNVARGGVPRRAGPVPRRAKSKKVKNNRQMNSSSRRYRSRK